uniref:Secreted protein n=1 Tax=Cacopsylla melanoneura TaxID=428564 RepID=A0A8D9BLJ9_9HEMI
MHFLCVCLELCHLCLNSCRAAGTYTSCCLNTSKAQMFICVVFYFMYNRTSKVSVSLAQPVLSNLEIRTMLETRIEQIAVISFFLKNPRNQTLKSWIAGFCVFIFHPGKIHCFSRYFIPLTVVTFCYEL